MLYKIVILLLVLTTMAFSSCGDNKNNPPLTQQEKQSGKAPADVVPVDEQPVPTKTVQPEYPELARKAGVEGTVWLKVLVGTEGTVKDVQVMKVTSNMKDGTTPGGLSDAAIAAIRQWEFKPAVKDKKPVETWVAIPVAFKLSKEGKKK